MAQQQALRSPPSAFMRTSNDSLPSRTFSSDSPTPADSLNALREIPRRRHVSSASVLPSDDGNSLFGGSPITDEFALANGDRTPTRHLSLLEIQGGTFTATDWRSLHAKQQALFDAERSHWRDERRLLQDEVTQLKQKLMIIETRMQQSQINDPSRSSSMSVQDKTRSTVMGERPSALEQSRSPLSPSNGAFSPLASVSGNAAAGLQQVSRQSSRDNKASSVDSAVSIDPVQRSGDVSNRDKGSLSVQIATPNKLHAQESPFSPPPSAAAMLSPPPPGYVEHAGHTPAKLGSMSAELVPGQHTPTRVNSLHNRNLGQTNGMDGDRPLRGPLGLATNPTEGYGSIQIRDLDAKLQDVTEHPEQHVPAVLQNSLLSPGANDADGESSSGATTPTSSNKPPHSEGDQGPHLKVKQSMNFGAPLGRIR